MRIERKKIVKRMLLSFNLISTISFPLLQMLTRLFKKTIEKVVY